MPYRDGEYNVAFSNSVIEHVGDFECQRTFANEPRRVADGIWPQTPAWELPFKPHFLALFVQYLPCPLRRVVCRRLTPRAWLDPKAARELTLTEHSVRLLRRKS